MFIIDYYFSLHFSYFFSLSYYYLSQHYTPEFISFSHFYSSYKSHFSPQLYTLNTKKKHPPHLITVL